MHKKVVIDFVNYAYLNLRVDVDRVYYKVSILAMFSIVYSGEIKKIIPFVEFEQPGLLRQC